MAPPRLPFGIGILDSEDSLMRRMTWLVVATTIAAGTLSAQTPAQKTDADGQAQLVRSVTINPTDSPMVQAAKRALAARQSAKNQIKIDDRSVRGRGRVFQATGPATVSMNLPPETGGPANTTDPAAEAARARAKELETKVNSLKQEQERMAAEAESPYGGDDTDEGQVEARQTQIPREIDQLQRQQQPTPPPPPGK